MQVARIGRVVGTDEPPDELEAETLYLVGEDDFIWCAVMLCPCGCGATVQLNMTRGSRPRWSVRQSTDGASIWPSVRRTAGCKSHFIVRRGEVIWWKDWDPELRGSGWDTPVDEEEW